MPVPERPSPNCTYCDHANHAGLCEVELASGEPCACDHGGNSTYNCDRCGADFPTVKGYYDHLCPFDF